MDGAISTVSGSQPRRSALGISAPRTSDAEHDFSGGLFEQILGLSFSSSTEFEPNESNNAKAGTSEDEVSGSGASRQNQSDEPESENDRTSDENAPAVAALSAQTDFPTPVDESVVDAEPTVVDTVNTETAPPDDAAARQPSKTDSEPTVAKPNSDEEPLAPVPTAEDSAPETVELTATVEEQPDTPAPNTTPEAAGRNNPTKNDGDTPDKPAAPPVATSDAAKAQADPADRLGSSNKRTEDGSQSQSTAARNHNTESDQGSKRDSQNKWFQGEPAEAATGNPKSHEYPRVSSGANEAHAGVASTGTDSNSSATEALVSATPTEPAQSTATTEVQAMLASATSSAAAASSTRTDTLVQSRLSADGGTPNTAAVTGGESSRVEAAGGERAKSQGTENHGTGVDELTQQQRVRLVQRIARSFSRLTAEGGEINLRLHPPQLGSLNVRVRLEGSSMTAKLTTESNAAREAIMESLPVLRGRLAEQGFEISQFQVEVADNGGDAASSGNSGQQEFTQADRDTNARLREYQAATAYRTDRDAQTAATTEPSSVLSWQTSTGIDLHA